MLSYNQALVLKQSLQHEKASSFYKFVPKTGNFCNSDRKLSAVYVVFNCL